MSLKNGTVTTIGRASMSDHAMIGDVCATSGHVLWVDQDHLQNEITDPTAWRIIDHNVAANADAIVAESNGDSANQPPTLNCDSQRLTWDEYAGFALRTSNTFSYSPNTGTKTEISHHVNLVGSAPSNDVISSLLTTWPTQDSYRTDVQLRTDDGRTVLASETGRAWGPRIGSGVVAWIENPASGGHSIVARHYQSDLTLGPVQTIDPTAENLLRVCGAWIVYVDSQTARLTLHNMTTSIPLGEADSFFQLGGVGCDSQRVVWASQGPNGQLTLNTYNLP